MTNISSLVSLKGEIEEFGHLYEGLRVDSRDAVVVEQEAAEVGEAEGVVFDGRDPVETKFHMVWFSAFLIYQDLLQGVPYGQILGLS